MAPDIQYRLFEPSLIEYEAVVFVYNQNFPDMIASAVTWQHWDQHRDPQRHFTRYTAEAEGDIIGYGFSLKNDLLNNKFRFGCYLLPEWETAVHIHDFSNFILKHISPYHPKALICKILENDERKAAWLKKSGFQVAMRYPISILELDLFDSQPFQPFKSKIASQGIEVQSLLELRDKDTLWQRKLYDLLNILNQDVPRPTAYTPPPFDNFLQDVLEDPGLVPEAWLIALDGDTYIGTSALYKSGDTFETLETELTGVLRPYRRQGLATVLKCQTLETAIKLGTRRIITSNEENNPMFQLNLRLGFKPQPGEVDWELKLTP